MKFICFDRYAVCKPLEEPKEEVVEASSTAEEIVNQRKRVMSGTINPYRPQTTPELVAFTIAHTTMFIHGQMTHELIPGDRVYVKKTLIDSDKRMKELVELNGQKFLFIPMDLISLVEIKTVEDFLGSEEKTPVVATRPFGGEGQGN